MGSEGMLIFCIKGWFFSALSCEHSELSFCLLVCIFSDVLLIIIAEFIVYLFLMFQYIKYIFWNINQVSLGSLWFSIFCMIAHTWSYFFFVFCSSVFASYLFTKTMNLWAYLTAEYGLILSKYLFTYAMEHLFRIFVRLVLSFGIPSSPSISAVATMYDSSSLRRRFNFPIFLFL